MAIKIKAVGYLQDVLGFKELDINLSKPQKLRDLINGLVGKRLNIDDIIILVNEKPTDLDIYIHDNDTITLVPIISGGRSKVLF